MVEVTRSATWTCGKCGAKTTTGLSAASQDVAMPVTHSGPVSGGSGDAHLCPECAPALAESLRVEEMSAAAVDVRGLRDRVDCAEAICEQLRDLLEAVEAGARDVTENQMGRLRTLLKNFRPRPPGP